MLLTPYGNYIAKLFGFVKYVIALSYEEFKGNPKKYLPIKDLKKIREILVEKVSNGAFGGSWRGCTLSRGKIWFHGIPTDNGNQFRITAFKIDEEWVD